MARQDVFASLATRTIGMPGDPEATVTIRRLSPRQLQRAERIRRQEALAEFRALGGAELMREIQALGGTAAARAQADPLDLFDRQTLLEAGVVSWSYEAPALSPESLADLTEPVAQALASEILRFSRPDLYQTAEAQEEAQKNG